MSTMQSIANNAGATNIYQALVLHGLNPEQVLEYFVRDERKEWVRSISTDPDLLALTDQYEELLTDPAMTADKRAKLTGMIVLVSHADRVMFARLRELERQLFPPEHPVHTQLFEHPLQDGIYGRE